MLERNLSRDQPHCAHRAGTGKKKLLTQQGDRGTGGQRDSQRNPMRGVKLVLNQELLLNLFPFLAMISSMSQLNLL